MTVRPCRHPGCPALVTERGHSYCAKHAESVRRPCAAPRCPALVKIGQRFCEEHEQEEAKKYDEKRGSRHDRGYDAAWERFRRMFLSINPLCAKCQTAGRVTEATLVHHVRPLEEGGARLDPDNCQALCRPCHERLHRRTSRRRK